MSYGAVYDWGVGRVAAPRRDQHNRLVLMQPSYRRQKPTVSVRRGLMSNMSQVRFEREKKDPIDLTPEERRDYAKACKALRSAYGLTDGLKLERNAFNDYLARRRAEDKQRRGW